MSWQMKLYIAVNLIALAYCAYHAVCIVKESRSRGTREPTSLSRPSRLSLASLLSISRSLEVTR